MQVSERRAALAKLQAAAAVYGEDRVTAAAVAKRLTGRVAELKRELDERRNELARLDEQAASLQQRSHQEKKQQTQEQKQHSGEHQGCGLATEVGGVVVVRMCAHTFPLIAGEVYR